jgi:hypothetical protein
VGEADSMVVERKSCIVIQTKEGSHSQSSFKGSIKNITFDIIRINPAMKIIIKFLPVFLWSLSFSQDSIPTRTDSAFFDLPTVDIQGDKVSISFSWTPPRYENNSYSISHYPSSEDTLLYLKHKKLITADPSKKNHAKYVALASALWDLNRVEEAESMLLKIVRSKEPYYESSYYLGSDIPGDKSKNSYGYGSCILNYKHYAYVHLCEIALERKEFGQAKSYLNMARYQYPNVYTCGTGYRMYRDKMDGLLFLCYEGLGEYDSIIIKGMPEFYDHTSDALINAIKQKYTRAQIDSYLVVAENSLVCIVDTFHSLYFLTQNYGTPEEKTWEEKYTSGSATMKLFGWDVNLPDPSLEPGRVFNIELFLKDFKESSFYSELHNPRGQ